MKIALHASNNIRCCSCTSHVHATHCTNPTSTASSSNNNGMNMPTFAQRPLCTKQHAGCSAIMFRAHMMYAAATPAGTQPSTSHQRNLPRCTGLPPPHAFVDAVWMQPNHTGCCTCRASYTTQQQQQSTHRLAAWSTGAARCTAPVTTASQLLSHTALAHSPAADVTC